MRTILLIEDDADMRDNTAEILELADYRVLKAENGRRGVEIARKEIPDLVLCDIMMPELDGYGVLHMLSRIPATAEVPFIFLSAKAERGDVRKGMELGADDYLTKPFEEGELLNAIEGRLKRSELFRKGFDNGFDGLNKFMDQARGLEALKDIGRDRKTRKIAKKEVLFHEGDELRYVPYVVTGKVRTFKVNKDGKEFVTGLHGEGDFVGYMGLLENGRAMETAEALEDTEVAPIPREDLLALLYKDRDVSIRFIKMLAHDVKEKEQHLLHLAYASVRQRVAQALLRVHERYADREGGELGVKISREDLASIVGTATESLIRCLTDLKEEGLIASEGRDIRMVNKAGLEKLARR
ncbi:MAG: response regulator [Flavobacteriales bacterium]|nr:response regulator [Flavobacteriales bacterium]MBK7754244.1 response regulator [Flavobacteriales bacterium]MBK9074556.1 response regulator [Flavobacteriales bacterium]